MMRSARMVATLVLLVLLAGCLATSVRDSWVAPDVQSPLDFEKILVVFISPDAARRNSAEDALVARLGADRAVASHTILSGDLVQNAQANEQAIRSQVSGQGFDAAIVMRLVNQEQQLTYTPGMVYPAYYGGFYGYWGYGWGAAYSPGYLSTDTVVSVETDLYSLEPDKLLYSGITETVNPSQVTQMVDDIATAVEQDLRKRRLIN
ncbi:MAG: hypothetical protein PVJ49_15405 [Acidobacteriota bacterium]|jgi:hypothetical protein